MDIYFTLSLVCSCGDVVYTFSRIVSAVAGQRDRFGLWDGEQFSVLSGMEIWSKIWFMLYFRRVCSSGSGNENTWDYKSMLISSQQQAVLGSNSD